MKTAANAVERWLVLLGATSAAFKGEARGNAPGFVSTDTSALKARFIQLSHSAEGESRFQR